MQKIIALSTSLLTIVLVYSGTAKADHEKLQGNDPRFVEPSLIKSPPTLSESMFVVKYELLGTLGVITGIGLKNWNWGSSNSFNTNDEGWFSMATGSGGIDKLGHGYAAYAISEGLRYQMLNSKYSYDRHTASLHAALFSTAFVTYIEIFDGYSDDHGYSKEDMVANMTGIGFSYLRGIYPELERLLDFRLQYWPSGYDGFNPLADYEGLNFRMVFKPDGLNAFRKSSLRFLELHLGYEARGFNRSAGFTRADRRREVFFGLGLNFDALFFKARRGNAGWLEKASSHLLRYVQPKWTTLDAEVWEDPPDR